MVEALKAAGGDVRYTEYPGVKHNSWDKAYSEPDLFPWLLEQKLSAGK
jgi:acetyl esterase/lipase